MRYGHEGSLPRVNRLAQTSIHRHTRNQGHAHGLVKLLPRAAFSRMLVGRHLLTREVRFVDRVTSASNALRDPHACRGRWEKDDLKNRKNQRTANLRHWKIAKILIKVFLIGKFNRHDHGFVNRIPLAQV